MNLYEKLLRQEENKTSGKNESKKKTHIKRGRFSNVNEAFAHTTAAHCSFSLVSICLLVVLLNWLL